MLAGCRLSQPSMPKDKGTSGGGGRGGQVVLKVVCVLKAGGKVQASPFGRGKAGFRSSNMRFPFLASFRRRQQFLSSSSPCLCDTFLRQLFHRRLSGLMAMTTPHFLQHRIFFSL